MGLVSSGWTTSIIGASGSLELARMLLDSEDSALSRSNSSLVIKAHAAARQAVAYRASGPNMRVLRCIGVLLRFTSCNQYILKWASYAIPVPLTQARTSPAAER